MLLLETLHRLVTVWSATWVEEAVGIRDTLTSGPFSTPKPTGPALAYSPNGRAIACLRCRHFARDNMAGLSPLQPPIEFPLRSSISFSSWTFGARSACYIAIEWLFGIHCFSSDGSFFSASPAGRVHIWKYTASRYIAWKNFPIQGLLGALLQATSSSILAHIHPLHCSLRPWPPARHSFSLWYLRRNCRQPGKCHHYHQLPFTVLEFDPSSGPDSVQALHTSTVHKLGK